MKCYLCNSKNIGFREGKVRDAPDLQIYECNDCGLVFLLSHESQDEIFYADSGMHSEKPLDIETWLKETKRDDQRRYNFLSEKIISKRLLDFGCGVAGFLLKAQNSAASVSGVEPEKRLRNHFSNNQLKVYPSLNDLGTDEKYELITAFHVIEHIPNPISILKSLKKNLVGGGEIIIEVPSSNDALLSLYDSIPFSEFTYWSCHLFLFNQTTLSMLAKKAGLKVNFIKQVQRYPLSNHLHWLAKNKPGGHEVWSFIDDPELNEAYQASLGKLGLCDTLIASFS